MRKGFTLAEVLITLGVIGVVSAMTIPSVVNKFRAKALETGFKKSYSNVSKAILRTQMELSSENLLRDYGMYDSSKGYYLFPELRNTFLKVLGEKETYKGDYNWKNYNGTASCSTVGWCPNPIYILKDGSSADIRINSGNIFISVDTNGPYKKPNRYGHDIFNFMLNTKTIGLPKQVKLYTEEELEQQTYPNYAGSPCSKKSNQGANGIGCAWYAFNNVNPDDKTKTYWDNLPK